MPERDCSKCTKQEMWGCTAVRWKHPEPNTPDHPMNWLRPASQALNIDGETSYACPRQHIRENTPYWSWMLKFYGFYKKGFLPQAGGLLEQSNAAIELFRILDDANAQCDAEAAKPKGQKGQPGRTRQTRKPG